MSSFPAADSPSDSQKLVPFNVAKDRVKNELAGAVRDLGSSGEESENLSSLVRKIRALFPELMQHSGRLRTENACCEKAAARNSPVR